MKTIPVTPSDSDRTINTVLGSEKFRVRQWWNEVSETWFLDIDGLTNDFKQTGIQVTVGVDLMAPYRLDYGAIILIGDEYSYPTFDNFGDAFSLTWFSPEEMAAL